LLGRNWLHKIKLNWRKIQQVSKPRLHSLLEQYSEVFQVGLGTMKGYQAKIEVEPSAKPHYAKARSVPYALRQKVEEELDRLVAEGILEPIEYSDWAASIIAVVKSDKKSVRICGDFRTTVNAMSQLNHYPIPKVEDLSQR